MTWTPGGSITFDGTGESIETFCINCHDSDGASRQGASALTPFSDGKNVPDIKGTPGNLWADSAHRSVGYSENSGNPISCFGNGTTDGCHGNAHGSDNIKLLAGVNFGLDLQNFCFRCHTDGKIVNNDLSETADDIEQSFSFSNKHDLGTSFAVGSDNFTLQCTTCHNPHIITGKYMQADRNKTPVTRPDFSDPTENPRAMGNSAWGSVSGQKMDDYAGAGTYRTPNSDTFTGAQLPDYSTFCLDCHAQTGGAPFDINWGSDPHGKGSANQPGGGGLCPDWWTCGKAEGWDGDDCIGTDEDCWPVKARGEGDQLWSRPPYTHEERIGGANFVLSCTDCHEAHGSGIRSIIRANPNGGTGSTTWNIMCNNCHYYYSDWHANMSCGNASCHVYDSIHRMDKKGSSGGTRTVNRDLVLDYRFENDLSDSGSFRLHGKWYDQNGSFVSGIFGYAIELNGNQLVQVGTRDDYWSTDEGEHGTWKYTEMKYNMTLEAWVYAAEDANTEYIIFSKHVGYGEGGYGFVLRKINNSLRAALNINVTGTNSGIRGAYSAVSIPLNRWTHVAATFDKSGPDRDPGDLTAGRIRIYVNGEDVTISDTMGDFMQPGAGETNIFPYSEHSPGNESICYNGDWCASEFSIGGFEWQNGFVGKIDEAKVWNITKNSAYFETADSQTPPVISSVTGQIGSDELLVTFTEGVYSSPGSGGSLDASDFILTDSDNGRTISSVTHTAGSNTALLLLNTPLDDTDDIDTDTLSAKSSSIYDEYDNEADSSYSVNITRTDSCSSSPVSFQLNETSGASYVLDSDKLLYGDVFGINALTGSEFYGDGSSANYIRFDYNTSCLMANTAMTLEARIKPAGLDGTAPYVKRIFARDSGGNYQLSVWRNNSWTNFNAPDGTASVAFWVKPVDAHGGTTWKPLLTDYNICPVVSDHWYRVKVVWNSGNTGVPGDIYLDDQGIDGAGTGENWAGYINCTDSDQSQLTSDRYLYEGDEISASNGGFSIGVNVNNNDKNRFNGLIDWIIWQDVSDYSGVDDPP